MNATLAGALAIAAVALAAPPADARPVNRTAGGCSATERNIANRSMTYRRPFTLVPATVYCQIRVNGAPQNSTNTAAFPGHGVQAGTQFTSFTWAPGTVQLCQKTVYGDGEIDDWACRVIM